MIFNVDPSKLRLTPGAGLLDHCLVLCSMDRYGVRCGGLSDWICNGNDCQQPQLSVVFPLF
jgi:hypothetical protein